MVNYAAEPIEGLCPYLADDELGSVSVNVSVLAT